MRYPSTVVLFSVLVSLAACGDDPGSSPRSCSSDDECRQGERCAFTTQICVPDVSGGDAALDGGLPDGSVAPDGGDAAFDGSADGSGPDGGSDDTAADAGIDSDVLVDDASGDPVDGGPDLVDDTGTSDNGGADSSGDVAADANVDIEAGLCPADPVPEGLETCPMEVCDGGCDGNICRINCDTEECDGADIVCPDEYACRVTCNGVDACDEATVDCPDENACELICMGGNDACGDLELTCGDGSCSIDCADDTCSGADVFCGPGACEASCDGTPIPAVNGCADACGCLEC